MYNDLIYNYQYNMKTTGHNVWKENEFITNPYLFYRYPKTPILSRMIKQTIKARIQIKVISSEAIVSSVYILILFLSRFMLFTDLKYHRVFLNFGSFDLGIGYCGQSCLETQRPHHNNPQHPPNNLPGPDRGKTGK